MTTPTQPRLSELVAGATKDIQTLVRGEIQLAKAEVTGSVKNAGAGVGLGIGAVAVLLFAVLIFAMSASFGISEGFDWPIWSGFAIVGLILVLLAVLLVFLARSRVRKVKAPEQTLAEAQKTKVALVDRQGKGVAAGLITPED